MTTSLTTSATKRFFLLTLVFLLSTNIAIILDIPILRQLLGFVLFVFAPGFLILCILKLNKLGLTEKVVLSVGLSIAFSIFAGLLINSVYPLFGYDTPLSANSVAVSFSVIVLILSLAAYLRNRTAFAPNWAVFGLGAREKAFLLLPAFFPLLGILGMRLMNTTDNNAVLILLLSLIAAYVILIVIMRRQVPERTYPVMIFLIGISVVLLTGLRSNHVIGRDTHWEYYFSQLAYSSQHWQIHGGEILNSCLSITLLPTIYQSFLNIDPEYLFKILYPVLFSVSPLVVYIIARKHIGSFYAFLCSFLFISQTSFFTTTALARVNLAVLFFILAMVVLFHDGITEFARRVLFIVFAASCVVSHYSTTYIFLFILLFTWLGMRVLPTIVSGKTKAVLLPENPGPKMTLSEDPGSASITATAGAPIRKVITIALVVLFFTMIFFWHAQVSRVVFSSAVSFVQDSFSSLEDFWHPGSRGGEVTEAFGQGFGDEAGYSGVPVRVKFVFNWLTVGLIAIGILVALVRHKRMVSMSSAERAPSFLRSRIDAEYFVLLLVCSAILVLSIATPYASGAYGVSRVYFQVIGILAMFLAIGGMATAKFVKWKPHWLILLILIPFFLCNAGLVDQAFDRPGLLLDSDGPEYYRYYVHDQESYAARWLRENGELEDANIYADGLGSDWLISQAGIYPWVDSHSLFDKDKKVDGYIFLRYENVVKGEFDRSIDVVELQNRLAGKDEIYANGGSEIRR